MRAQGCSTRGGFLIQNTMNTIKEKISSAIVMGMFPFMLTANISSTIATLSTVANLSAMSNHLFSGINLKLDEEKWNTMEVVATAYSSTPEQTDSTPFITATGNRVRDGIIAANFLTFKTKIKIPELYGDKIFVVDDRMNRRYNEVKPPRIDIWMENYSDARKFGLKQVAIVIVSEETKNPF